MESNYKNENQTECLCSTFRREIALKEMVNHPKHYNNGKYEVIDVIDDWGLGFSLGNTIKYIARCEHKNNKLEDLKKAMLYLQHEIYK